MKASEIYAGRFLKADDFTDEPDVFKITGISMQQPGANNGDNRERIALKLQGHPKLLLLNVSNADRMITAFGDETNDWIGKSVAVYQGEVQYKGKWVPGIVVEPQTDKKD